ncbi:MATE family efflux transporter [Floccifex sp.]|uniref:MATE family efflux transporter n=1 Tax=Floccifex sp. TaxID=2815810 RepID=UPI003F0C6088
MNQSSLTQGNIKKSILLFSIPFFFSNLFQQLYNTIDTLIIGHYLGDLSLAAIGSTGAIFELIVGFCNGLGLGFGIVISRYYGAKETDKLKKAVANAILLSLIFSISLTILSYFFLPNLLTLLNTPSTIFKQALSYIQCISLFLVVTMFYNLSAGLLRAIGDSLTPLIVLIISSVLNVILDILFITQLNMGIQGAAIATVIAQILSTIICVGLIFKKAKILIPNKFSFDKQISLDLAAQGFSMGLMVSIVSIGTVTLQFAINKLGTDIIAAHTSARKLLSIFSLFLGALCSSISTFVSQNRGANQKKRIIEGIHFVNKLGILYVCVVSIVVFFLAPTFVHLLSGSSNPEIINNATLYLRINIPSMIILVVLLNDRNSLQGLGKKIIPLVSSIIELVGKVIFTYLLIPYIGYFGVCLCEPVIWLFMTIQLEWSLKKALNEF